MVQSASVIPCSRASPVSTIPPSSTSASHVPPATNMQQANLDAPRRGGAKKSTRNICINCGTNTATLWRRIKSPEEIELKRPGLVAQREFPQYTGKLACNSCALYWSLHGVGLYTIILLSLFLNSICKCIDQIWIGILYSDYDCNFFPLSA